MVMVNVLLLVRTWQEIQKLKFYQFSLKVVKNNYFCTDWSNIISVMM